MRLHRGTLRSGPVNLSRWSWSFSANREPIWSGSATGAITAISGSTIWACKSKTYVCVTTRRKNCPHYSTATTDFEYLFPFGWGELWGVADRTDFDLNAHQKESGESLEYFDPETNEKYIPYVVEPVSGRGPGDAGLFD